MLVTPAPAARQGYVFSIAAPLIDVFLNSEQISPNLPRERPDQGSVTIVG